MDEKKEDFLIDDSELYEYLEKEKKKRGEK